MLIKSSMRIITDDRTQTYKQIGFTIHMHNRFFSGSIIVGIKFGYKPLDLKVDVVKHKQQFVRVRGFDTKYLEVRLISIPKGK